MFFNAEKRRFAQTIFKNLMLLYTILTYLLSCIYCFFAVSSICLSVNLRCLWTGSCNIFHAWDLWTRKIKFNKSVRYLRLTFALIANSSCWINSGGRGSAGQQERGRVVILAPTETSLHHNTSDHSEIFGSNWILS